MRSMMIALLLMTTAGFVVAQESAETKKADEPKMSPREEKVVALEEAMVKENQELLKKYRAEEDDDKKSEIRKEGLALPEKYAGKFLDLAQAEPTDVAALKAIGPVLSMGSKPQVEQAIDLIQKHHMESKELKDVVPALTALEFDRAETLLTKIIDSNPHNDVQGVATMTMAELLLSQKEELKGEKAEAAGKRAEQLLDRVVTQFSDVENSNEQKIGEVADEKLFFVRNVGIGKSPSTLSGTNLKGETETLSDYKGKVVVLDIWATWCPPCRAMIPHENEMVKELKDKPFALISVSADAKKKTLTDFIDKTPMPWTHWWAGQSSPILRKLNIEYFPTIYVIDHKGVIRYKDIRGEKLEEAVKELIAEAQKKDGE